MSDVRDILELHTSADKHVKSKNNKKKSRRFAEQAKRPQGVHREVWGLINKDDSSQPPLIPTDEPKLYKHPKAKLRRGVRKWHWVAFKNPARQDSAVFNHWRCVNDDPNKEYPFAKYNKKVNVAKYTDAEYEQYLKDEVWSKEETDHLFELCQTYDLRFFIIHDRWDPSRFADAKSRSIDELKDRYYKVTGIMQKLKIGCDDSQIYMFDLEHEQKRREQLEKLFNRTKEQVDEELYLIEELKKIEVCKKERERKRQEVDKLLTAVGDMETSAATQVNKIRTSSLFSTNSSSQQKRSAAASMSRSSSSSNKQRRDRDRSSGGLNTSLTSQMAASNGGSASNSLNNSADGSLNQSASPTSLQNVGDKSKKALIIKTGSESSAGGSGNTGGIKFPDTKTTGVSLRSYKMKLPQSVALRKLKAIECVLDELQIESRPAMSTEAICEQFNELRSDILLLYELYQALCSCEYELQTLRHRYESVLVSKNVDLAQFEMPMQTSQLVNTLMQANNTPQKRISEILEPPLNQQSGPLERRRKAAINQTNFIKRLRGRNAT